MATYNTNGVTSVPTDEEDKIVSSGLGSKPSRSSRARTADVSDNEVNPVTAMFRDIAARFTSAGATLSAPTRPKASTYRPDSGGSIYDGEMFDVPAGVPAPLDRNVDVSAIDSALEDAFSNAAVPQTYLATLGDPQPEATIDGAALQAPDPIMVTGIIVKAGDTLTAIAKENGIPVQDVIDANPQIKNPNMIRPGDVVSVPDPRFEDVPDPRFEGVPKPRGVPDSPRLSDLTDFPRKDTLISDTTDSTQGLLDLIAYGEGAVPAKLQRQAKLGIGSTAYDMVYGYGSVVAPSKAITEMTLAEVETYQKELINATKGTLPKTKEGTSAVGKYQVLHRSLFGRGGSSADPKKDSWADKLGLDENTVFSPEIQEKIGRLALRETGYDNYMAGNKSQANTLKSIANMWASVEGSTAGQGTHTSKKKVKGFLELVKPGSTAETGLMSQPAEEADVSSETEAVIESVIKEVNAAPTTAVALDIVTEVAAKKDPLLMTNPVQWIYEQPNLIGLTEGDAEGQDTIVGFFSSSLGRADQREYVTAAGRAKAGEGYSVTSKSGAWCATFVDHVLTNLGMDRLQNNKEGKKTNYARVGATHYQTLGEGVKLSETKAGDLAVFNAHIGFVVGKVEGIATSDKGNATALQEGLTKAGFSTKGIDGAWGPNSAKALTAYQESNNLQVTGNVTPETFKSLTNKEGKVTTNVLVLGGNQNNSVNVTSYPASKINNFRRVGPVQDLDDKTFKAVTTDIQKAGSTS